ncbi:MAG: hypothetical protein ACRDHL_04780, partial [Candidatus Promineifilaceae bacterium]
TVAPTPGVGPGLQGAARTTPTAEPPADLNAGRPVTATLSAGPETDATQEPQLEADAGAAITAASPPYPAPLAATEPADETRDDPSFKQTAPSQTLLRSLEVVALVGLAALVIATLLVRRQL